MKEMTLTMESYKRMEKRLAQLFTLEKMIFPETPIDELVDLSARDLKDAINARIREGRYL